MRDHTLPRTLPLTLTSMSGARTKTQMPDPCTVGTWQGSWQAGAQVRQDQSKLAIQTRIRESP